MTGRGKVHQICTMSPVPNYILRMALAGTVLGAIHGGARGWQDFKRDVPYMEHWRKEHVIEYIVKDTVHDAMYGVLFGPWAPILAPAILYHWSRERYNCSWIKRMLPPK
jgi:hypothetical protein